jgi:O-antigen ligase
LRIGAAAILSVPLLQLIPLSPALWVSLPGRSDAVTALLLTNAPVGWRPISVSPDLTLASALALIPALALFLAVPRLSSRELAMLALIIIAAALLSAGLGAAQKASGGLDALTPFATAHAPDGPGLFVNRNHQAAFLLACIPILAAVPRLAIDRPEPWQRLVCGGLILVLAAGAAATISRMGITVLPIALILGGVILFEPRVGLRPLIIGVGVAVLILAIGSQTSGAQAVFARFTGTDIRYQYWADSAEGIRSFWPVGSGLGTFPELFPRFENLNTIDQSRPYNAHNDYLELLFESGVLGVAAAVPAVALLLRQAARLASRQLAQRIRIPALAGFATIAILLLHSIVDYPLRMLSCLTLLGFAAGLVMRAVRPTPGTTAKAASS